MGNPLALAVLTHLFEKPRHPYELATTLRERKKEKSIRLNYGSLYTVVEALERDGYIRTIETTREGRRPEKTVYEITQAGEVFMMYWLRELVGTPIKEFPQFEAALSLLPVLPPEEAIPLLEGRITHLKKTLDSGKHEEKEQAALNLPRLFSIEGEFYAEMTKAELKFVAGLLKDIQSDAGGFTTLWKQAREAVLGSRTTNNKTVGSGKSKRKKE
jgi:DNA-binding PadR family transcriptional regulator